MEIARFIARWLEQAGLEVHWHEVAPNRPNVVGILRGTGEGKSLILNGHIDTVGVAGMTNPHQPYRHEGRLYERGVYDMKGGVAACMVAIAAALKPNWLDLMRDFFAYHPAVMSARAQDTNGFTLIHGDAGPYNIMVPREATRPLYLIDRQPFDWSLTTWLGVYDLAFAIVLDWDSDSRRELERPVLQHYHQHLLRRGVTGYTWEQLWDDYRLAAVMGISVATEYCRGGYNEPAQKYWLPRLQKSLTACDDLACAERWR